MSLIAIDVAGVLSRYRQVCGRGATTHGVLTVVKFYKEQNKTVVGIVPEALEKVMPKFIRSLMGDVITYTSLDVSSGAFDKFAVHHQCPVVTNTQLAQRLPFQTTSRLQIRFTFSAQGTFCPDASSPCQSLPSTSVHDACDGEDPSQAFNRYVVVRSYDGVEQDECGSLQLGYLCVEVGDQVELLCLSQEAGHSANRFKYYVYGETRCRNGPTCPGWLPTDCLEQARSTPAQSSTQVLRRVTEQTSQVSSSAIGEKGSAHHAATFSAETTQPTTARGVSLEERLVAVAENAERLIEEVECEAWDEAADLLYTHSSTSSTSEVQSLFSAAAGVEGVEHSGAATQMTTETIFNRTTVAERTAKLIQAVEDESWQEAAQLLRAGGCNINARTRDFGHYLLQASAQAGALDVCQLLVAQRADVNAVDGTRTTPLMSCVVGGDHGKVVSMLLDANADASFEAFDGSSAIKWAKRLGRNQVMCVLRKAGIMQSSFSTSTSHMDSFLPEAVDVEERVRPAAVQMPIEGKGNKITVAEGTTKLIQAVEEESWQKAAQLLRARPCDVNARTRDFGHSLLQASAQAGALEVCQLLLAQRADVNAVDGERRTPLMSCVLGGDHGEIISMLLGARADALMEGYDGFSAIIWAGRLDRKKANEMLVKARTT